jgi:hypothetical protein
MSNAKMSHVNVEWCNFCALQHQRAPQNGDIHKVKIVIFQMSALLLFKKDRNT